MPGRGSRRKGYNWRQHVRPRDVSIDGWNARKQAKREIKLRKDEDVLFAAGVISEQHCSEPTAFERDKLEVRIETSKEERFARNSLGPESIDLPSQVVRSLEQAVSEIEAVSLNSGDVARIQAASSRNAKINSRLKHMSNRMDSEELAEKFLRQRQSDGYLRMQPQRERLPSFSKQTEIVDAVRKHQVVVISGETGCGKTTQVPQFILDAALTEKSGAFCNIICTQPRRISAIGVAERVASERAESVGSGMVGYQIRLERRANDSTRLLFCTAGILLRRLQNDNNLAGVTHILLDEVHERSLETDFLLIILRDLLSKRSDLRLVLMSATLNAEVFAQYFAPSIASGTSSEWLDPFILHIPGFTHPVKELFLADAVEACRQVTVKSLSQGTNRTRRQGVRSRAGSWRSDKHGASAGGQMAVTLKSSGSRDCTIMAGYSERTADVVEYCMECCDDADNDWAIQLLVELVKMIDATTAQTDDRAKGAILIFLEGWDAISKLNDALSALSEARFWHLLPLHGQLPTQQQRGIFERPPCGTRKIVLATNIAESSITIDDVTIVLDCGKHKEKTYDAQAKIGCLLPAWVSQASSHQRRGRAGRTRPGICYHLFPREKLTEFAEYQEPEMLRTPLEQLCLQVRQLRLARGSLDEPQCGEVLQFLLRALTPPSKVTVTAALSTLTRIGALSSENEELTILGRHLALLPMDPQIVGLLSHRNPFVFPLDKSKKSEANRAKKAFSKGTRSDHKALLVAFESWRVAERRGEGASFAWRNYLSAQTLKMVCRMSEQFIHHLHDSGLLSSSSCCSDAFSFANRNSHCWPAIKAALAAGLFPNLVRVDRGREKLFTAEHGYLKLHPSSVNAGKADDYWCHRWLCYHDKVRTVGGLYVYDCSELAPLHLLFFGGVGPLLDFPHPNAAESLKTTPEAEAEHEDDVVKIVRANGGQFGMARLSGLIKRHLPLLRDKIRRSGIRRWIADHPSLELTKLGGKWVVISITPKLPMADGLSRWQVGEISAPNPSQPPPSPPPPCCIGLSETILFECGNGEHRELLKRVRDTLLGALQRLVEGTSQPSDVKLVDAVVNALGSCEHADRDDDCGGSRPPGALVVTDAGRVKFRRERWRRGIR